MGSFAKTNGINVLVECLIGNSSQVASRVVASFVVQQCRISNQQIQLTWPGFQIQGTLWWSQLSIIGFSSLLLTQFWFSSDYSRITMIAYLPHFNHTKSQGTNSMRGYIKKICLTYMLENYASFWITLLIASFFHQQTSCSLRQLQTNSRLCLALHSIFLV